MPHHFTVDVEEYFHPTPLERWVPRSSWNELPRRADRTVRRLLDVMAERGVQGTFFVLGWLADREPSLIKAIAAGGHEIASHGWNHRVVTDLTPLQFREEVRSSKRLLEDLSGTKVVGYRAPSFSIVPGLEWALDVLLDEDYAYDSSLFPVRTHPSYGYPCERDPHALDRPGGPLAEVPPTTLRILGENLPAAGGAYFRFMPYALVRTALRSAERRGAAGTFYIHPWELDGGLPQLELPWRVRFRTRARTADPWKRIARLLNDFEFCRIDETLVRMEQARQGRSAA